MSAVSQVTVSLGWTLQCYRCGIAFAFDKTQMDNRYEDGRDFHCPNGHVQSYRETKTQRLEKALEKAKKRHACELQAAQADAQMARNSATIHERSARAFKGHVTRIKNRVGKGVCPCCNRTFENVARHMESQHPDWTDAAPTEKTA